MKKQKSTINKYQKDAVSVFNEITYLAKFCGMKNLHIALLTHE